jgi:transketolase
MLSAALRASMDDPEPIYFRIGRGRDVDVYSAEDMADFEFGKAITHHTGIELTVIATGSMVEPSRAAVEELRAAGRDVGLIDMHTIKPLDADAVLAAAERSPVLMTVEEHNIIGGLGGAVAEVLADAGAPARLHRHGIPDVFSLIGPPTHLYEHYGLDAAGVRGVVQSQLDRS